MRFNLLKIMGIWVVISMSMLGMAFTVSAEEKKYYAKKGFYVGVTVPYNTIGGDFDGETALIAPGEVILVPKVESNYGWGILIGGRGPSSAIELSYLRSTHDVTWLGAKGEADYNMVNLDFKGFFLADKPTQPYLLLGLCFPWLVVKDASADVYGDVGDATFKGIGLNLGGGLAYYLHPKVSISGGVIYRWISYGSAEGVSGTDRDMEDRLGGSGLNFNVMTTFTF